MATSLVPYLPSTFSANYEWRTEVLSPPGGDEQRICLWSHPKVTVTITYDMVGEFDTIRQGIRALLFSDPNIKFEIPIRYEGVFGTPLGTSVSLDLTLAADWAVVGNRVYVEDNENENGYAATIVAVDPIDGEITLDASPDGAMSAMTRVFPLALVQPTTPSSLGRYRMVENGRWTITGTIQSFYDQGVSEYADEFLGDLIWDRPALQDEDEIAEGFDGNVDLIGEPLTESRSLFSESRIRRELSFNAGTQLTEWLWYKQLLWNVRGQQGAFWRPTFRPDLVIEEQPTSPTIFLVIRKDPDYRPWFDSGFFQYLLITRTDESTEIVRAVSVDDPLDGTLVVQIDDSAPFTAYNPEGEEIAMISFIERTRLAEDIVNVVYTQGQLTIDLATLTGPWA